MSGGRQHPVLAHLERKYRDGIPRELLGLAMLARHEGRELTVEDVDAIEFDPTPIVTAARRTEYDNDALVYYVLFNGLVKIGTTRNLAQRLAQLPHDEVLATETGSFDVEAERHRQFASLRYKGEWFRHEGALAEHIAALVKGKVA